MVAWNSAAAAVLADYGELAPPGSATFCASMFRNPAFAQRSPTGKAVARFVVAAFRADVARAGAARTCQVAGRRTLRDESRIRGDVA